ncbi:hypothetical protein CRUP_032127 [Coryphaenoides rupestris]|nr:hypothetical protein CRUP_032127 [Coryphaenoides rupestris]
MYSSWSMMLLLLEAELGSGCAWCAGTPPPSITLHPAMAPPPITPPPKSASYTPTYGCYAHITEHLYISNMRAAADVSLVRRFQITCVVNVSEKRTTGGGDDDVDYIHIPVADSPQSALGDHFHRVADKIESVRRSHGRTLVHCNAGVSRSAALCIAYLMKHQDQTLREAHTWLRSRRPIVRPNAGFWRQLIDYERSSAGHECPHGLLEPGGHPGRL